MKRHVIELAIVLSAIACHSNTVDTMSDEPDASVPREAPPDLLEPPDGSCLSPDAGYGDKCEVDSDCICGNNCAAKRCVPQAACNEALFEWVGATSNTDGTCLTNVAGYKIYFGNVSGGPYPSVFDVGRPCTAGVAVGCGDMGMTVDQQSCAYRFELTDATWYFVITTYDANGVESAYSNEVSKATHCP